MDSTCASHQFHLTKWIILCHPWLITCTLFCLSLFALFFLFPTLCPILIVTPTQLLHFIWPSSTSANCFSSATHTHNKHSECPSVNSTDSKLVMSVEGTKIHDRAHFSCLDDLQLVGADEITCTTQGSWSHAVPFCRGRKSLGAIWAASCSLSPSFWLINRLILLFAVVQCPEVDSDDPNLKVLSSNRTLGSKSFFSCPEGYKLIGSPVSICLKNNTWSASVPFCQGKYKV